MPRKTRKGRDGESDDSRKASEQIIERGIDALNAMCVEMRKLGMIACADALDGAFAICLREVVARYDARHGDGEPDPPDGSEDI